MALEQTNNQLNVLNSRLVNCIQQIENTTVRLIGPIDPVVGAGPSPSESSLLELQNCVDFYSLLVDGLESAVMRLDKLLVDRQNSTSVKDAGAALKKQPYHETTSRHGGDFTYPNSAEGRIY